jgi:hypothetical protein
MRMKVNSPAFAGLFAVYIRMYPLKWHAKKIHAKTQRPMYSELHAEVAKHIYFMTKIDTGMT